MNTGKTFSSILFLDKGKQITYYVGQRRIFDLDYNKKVNVGDKIVFDKILSTVETKEGKEECNFGTPFVEGVKLIGEVVQQKKLGKKQVSLKYKAKKRTKRKVGSRKQYTCVKIVSVE